MKYKMNLQNKVIIFLNHNNNYNNNNKYKLKYKHKIFHNNL